MILPSRISFLESEPRQRSGLAHGFCLQGDPYHGKRPTAFPYSEGASSMVVTRKAHKLDDDGTVVVAVKTPLMPKPTTARLPGRLNLRQAVEQLQKEKPKDAHAARVLQQLAREMTEVHHFLAVRPTGIEK